MASRAIWRYESCAGSGMDPLLLIVIVLLLIACVGGVGFYRR